MKHLKKLVCVTSVVAACITGQNTAQAESPMEMINKADSGIFDWQLSFRCGRRLRHITVKHWIPVAYVETSPSTQSYLDGQSKAATPAGMSRQSGLESAAHVRVFTIQDPLWQTSKLALSKGGLVCSVHDAWGGAGQGTWLPAQQCDVDLGAFAALAATSLAATAGMLAESYNSSMDPGWVSGCRDAAKVQQAMASQLRCTNAMMADSLQHNSPDTHMCFGNWGNLYPRQAREIGMTGATAAAKTAYRAMSTAKEHLGVLPFPVDAGGKMQQVNPQRGGQILPGQTVPHANNSPNAQYGFLYWRHVTCCR
jgi:hypothetical protein